MTAPDVSPPRPSRRLLELFVLSGLALAQPLFDIFGRGAETFVFRQATTADVIVFCIVLVFVPALLLWLPGLALSRWPVAARLSHDVAMAALWIVLALQLVKRLPTLPLPLTLALACAAAVVATVATSTGKLRLWFTYLSPSPVVFAAAFLLLSPVSDQLLAARSVGAKQVQLGRPAPVTMIVLDELPLGSLVGPDGHVDADLFPGFAALEREGTFFGSTTSNSWATTAALPSLLSGKAPRPKSLPVAASHPDTLFTLLGATHEPRVHELLALCPVSVCDQQERGGVLRPRLRGLALDVAATAATMVDPRKRGSDRAHFGEAVAAIKAATTREAATRTDSDLRVPARFDAFLADVSRPSGSKPAFAFLHLLMPHSPWNLLPDGTQYSGEDSPVGLHDQRWAVAARPAELARQRHLLQVQHTDRLLREVIGSMKRQGTWDESLVVVTADHGVAFRPGEPDRDVTDANAADLAWVPLFIKRPGDIGGGLSLAPAQSMDILPTVADLLQVKPPWEVEGRSLLRPAQARERLFVDGAEGGRIVQDESRREVLQNSAGRFARGAAGDRYRVFRIGPDRGLVGRALAELRLTKGPAGRVWLHDLGLEDVDRSSGRLPALVTGRITDGAVDARVAVVVNGVVAGVSPTFTDRGGTRMFSTLVPPHLIRNGSNELQVLAVSGRAASPVLALLDQD